MEHILSLSYGKDSLACLGAIEQLGLPLDRIIHAEIWATKSIPADLPPMIAFKSKADGIIKRRYGIEEMSELSKALLKHRRAEKSPEAWDYERTRQSIYEEIADVVIMLTQLIIIYGGREEIRKDIESKVTRLAERLDKAEKEAGAHKGQESDNG